MGRETTLLTCLPALLVVYQSQRSHLLDQHLGDSLVARDSGVNMVQELVVSDQAMLCLELPCSADFDQRRAHLTGCLS